MKFILIAALASILSGCATLDDIEVARGLSDDRIREFIKEGRFAARPGCVTGGYGALVCELVNQDRRTLVAEIIQKDPKAAACFPLLACAPSQEAYRHWKAQGASVGMLGDGRGERRGPGAPMMPWTSLQVAAGNANPEIVALHLADGADPKARGGWAAAPLDTALLTWDRATRAKSSRDGYPPGLGERHVGTTYFSDILILRDGPELAEPSAEIVRLLIEAGASLDGLTSSAAMAETGVGYQGWYMPGQTYRSYFTSRIPGLSAVERQAVEVRNLLGDCRSRKQRAACEQVLMKAAKLSFARTLAQQQIAQIDQEQGDWSSVLAAQRCRVQRDNWAYEGSACANGLAQGAGRARSRDRSSVYDGQFAQGQPVSGRLTVSGRPYFEGGFRNWTPEGAGICWHQGQPEECRMLNGQRIDALHKQREENARLQEQTRERERRDEEARMQRQIEEVRRRREQEAEERRERRNERALAAGIASMRGGNSGPAASNDGLSSSLRLAQQQNQIMAQGMADIQRAQAQREEARREQARRDAAQQEAERQARQQAQQRLAAQQSQQAQAQQSARQQLEREAAAQRALEDEARRQQEARAAEARREAERQQRERDRQAQQQAEQQDKAKLEADYLKAIKDGTRMQAISCYGNHYVTGSRPRVKEPAHMGSCVDVTVTAWCPGDRVGRPVVATNFVGMGGCFGDIHKIEPRPACAAEQMRVVVEEVRVCR